MSTLAEIEAAAEALPPEQKVELFHFLAARLGAQRTAVPEILQLKRSQRGFPISKGRVPFTSEDLARIEAEAEADR